MRSLNFLLIMSGAIFLLSGCGKTSSKPHKPELAPICPEGFYRVEDAKSCMLLEAEDFQDLD